MVWSDLIEKVILGRLYAKHISQSKNYHWHVFVGEIHDPHESHLNGVLTNHKLAISNSKNVTKKSEDGTKEYTHMEQ